jgi:hypothetical protein
MTKVIAVRYTVHAQGGDKNRNPSVRITRHDAPFWSIADVANDYRVELPYHVANHGITITEIEYGNDDAWHASSQRYHKLRLQFSTLPLDDPQRQSIRDEMAQVLTQHDAEYQQLRIALGSYCPVCHMRMVDARCPDEAAHFEIERLER